MLLSIAGAVTASAVVFLVVKAERERRLLARQVHALAEQLRQITLELRAERARSGGPAPGPSGGARGAELGRSAPIADGGPQAQPARSRTLH
jgi:hypothetical protein